MNSNDFFNIILGLAKVGSVVSIIVCAAGIAKLIQSKKNGEGGFRYVKIIANSAIVALFCILGIKGLSKEMEITGNYIEQNHPASIANITYGQAIRNVCDNIEWSRIGSESSSNKHSFVQMDADCNYGGRDRKLVIQFDYGIEDFALVDEDTPFEITFVGFDDAQNTNVSDMQDIMYSMFEFYADENGIRLDESMKEGILYTNGASAALASPDDAVDSETSYNDDASYDTDALSDAGQYSEEGGLTFADLSKYSFSFASSVGSWATGLEINADGSFTGCYSDFDMGITGPGYPNGSTIICNFQGRFTQLKKVNEYTYSMKMEGLSYENAKGSQKIENGVKYVYTGAYGVEGGDEFLVYLPGAPVSELPEEFIIWVQYDISGASELSSYALCDVARQYGFWGYIEEGADSDAEAALQEVPQQEMIPGEDYTDYYSWLGEYNCGETELSFQIFSDGVQYPDGHCGYITMRHRGIEVNGEMYYMGGNKFRWEEELGSEKNVSYVYPVMNNGKRQLELYDSNGVYYDTYTVYSQLPWITG